MIQKSYHIENFADGSLETVLAEVAALSAYQSAAQVLLVVFEHNWNTEEIERQLHLIADTLPKAEVAGITHFDDFASVAPNSEERCADLSFLFFEQRAFSLCRRSASGLSDAEAGAWLNETIRSVEDCKGVMLLFSEFGRNADALLAEAGRGVEDIPIFGGTAGLFVEHWGDASGYVFDLNGVMQDAMVAVLLHGKDLRVKASYNLGWTPIGKPMTITGMADDFRVTEIDGRPAMDIYRQYLGLTPALVMIPNICEFPLLVDRDGMEIARVPLNCERGGRLRFAAALHAGEQVRFSYGAQQEMFSQIYHDAADFLDFAPQGMFLTICGNRLIFLKDAEHYEVDYYRQVAPQLVVMHGNSELYRCGGAGAELNSALLAVGIREGEPEKQELSLAKKSFLADSASTNFLVPLEYRVMTFLSAVTADLEQMTEQARRASRAKSNFLANMSHEIRTPINAILGMDEMILRESGERETIAYAGDIQSAGKTLLSIINDILDLSKVEEGKMEIIPAQYELGSLINDLVNMIRPRADDKGLRLEVHVDESIPHLLFGDEIRIRQCALNILNNAVKYTEKGTVTLDVGYEKKDEKSILLRFRVTDTGIGMKQEDMDKLFAPFSRIEEKRNRFIEGTGLGMSITKQLLTLMGSSLEVESVYGEGSSFCFSLEQPVALWAAVGTFAGRIASGAPRPAYRESFHAPDARILVVDDTPVNLSVMRGLLKKTQLQIDTAESGRAGLKMAAQQRYDVVFIDHMMPEMDGMEMLREFRKLPGAETVPCVALTANAVSGAREMYIEAGFTDYLAKPVDGAKLENLLTRLLPGEKVLSPAEYRETKRPAAEKPLVLVVDDDALICNLAGDILGGSCRVEACRSGAEAPARAERLRPALILLDINLGGKTGFEVLQALRDRPATRDIPVVFLTGESNEEAEIEGFRSGAADFVRKPFVPEVLRQRTKRIIEHDRLQRGLQSEVKRQTLRAERLTKEMMLALSQTVDAKDHYTNGHSQRVAAYSAEIARRMGKSAREQEQIYEMGLLHDVGKIGVSEEIINKDDRLTDEEFNQIKRHTVIGGEILRLIDEMPELSHGARSHHEKYDGSGYPDGLSGDDIPEAARIICLADCYDAMTSTRTYSTPKPQSAVRAEIERCSGTQFDPEIAKVLLRMIDEDKDYVMTERTADIRIWKDSDRLWTLAGQQPEEEPAAAEEAGLEEAGPTEPPAELPDWLRGIGELDLESGVLHCGTEETYLETLKIYAQTVQSNADEIETFWNAGDVANTTVKVHALKSTSRAVGAEELGAFAERLELAGKAGETETLRAELGDLLARYRALGKELSPLCESARSDEELPLIPPEKLQEAYDTLREMLSGMDYDSIDFVLDFLAKYRIPEDERERCESIRKAAENFDWDKIDEVLK